MGERVTIYDIAKQLNISTATVNRALNGKNKVSEETRKTVIETANSMGFKPNKAAKSLARNTIKLGLVINYDIPDFHEELLRGAKAAYEELSDYNVEFKYYIASQPMHSRRQEIIDKMKEMAGDRCNGILFMPSPDQRGYHELMRELATNNIVVATIVTDVLGSSRLFSLRQNGLFAGKIAAELLWYFTSLKKVAIFTGYKSVGVHAETIEGFFETARQKPIQIIGVYENQDDPELAYYNTEKLISQHPDIEGIYINTANSSSVCKKLKETGYGGRVKIVASDVFPELKEHMMEDIIHATLFQDPFNQGRLALKYLYQHIAEGAKFENDILIKPQIVLKSNMDLFI
jgi:Transcriptional regulators